MDWVAGTLSLADGQIENRGRNQSVNVQAQQRINDFTKDGQERKMKQGWKRELDKREKGRDVASRHFHV